MAYSNDLRLKVLAALRQGESAAAVARRFDIGERTARRFKELHKQTGDVTPRKTGPKGPTRLTADDDQIMIQQVGIKPGITARELIPLLSVKMSISAVCRRLIKLGLSLKKSP